MKGQQRRLPLREQYRALVSLLIIPLGCIVIARALMVGLQAWMLIVLGLAFVVLGIVRLRAYARYKRMPGVAGKRKRV
jgi:hypothetical protein